MTGTWPSDSERIGVVTGLAAEARIARRLGWRVAIGGGGAEGAYRAAHTLIEEGVLALVSFGLAAGLDPALPAGTILVPAQVQAAGRAFEASAGLAERLGGMTPCALLGSVAIVRTAEEKRGLWEQTGCAALDMESGGVAETASRYGLPFAALRAICDPAWMDLPPAALIALSEHGAIKLGGVVAAMARQPSQLADLLRLGRYAARARGGLVGRVAALQAERPLRPAM